VTRSDTISEVWVDDAGRLHLKPASKTFPLIYRAAMEVHWDEPSQSLFSPAPREWTYVNWFDQIVAAVKDEYGINLLLTPSTAWRNTPNDLRSEILNR
jgi:hypothetical protein